MAGKMAETSSGTLEKPHVLVVGGSTRNFGSKKLKDLFEFTLVDKDEGKIPNFRDKKFEAMVILRFISKNLLRKAKEWADEHDLMYVEAHSIGRCPLLLSERIPKIRKYLEGVEAKSRRTVFVNDPVDDVTAEGGEAQAPPETQLAAVQQTLSDDDLWLAYGEKFVTELRGITNNGEIFKLQEFKTEVIEYLTGLKGDLVDQMMSILRIQGVISEVDGSIVVGQIADIDFEKVKNYIATQAAAPSTRPQSYKNHENPSTIRGEVRDAFAAEEPPAVEEEEVTESTFTTGKIWRGRFSREELTRMCHSIPDGKKYIGQAPLFVDLHKAGVRRNDGKPFSPSGMRNYQREILGLGILKVVQDGPEKTAFRIRHGSDASTATAPVPVKSSVPPPPTAVLVPSAPPPPPKPVFTVNLDNVEEIYKATSENFPQKKIPFLMALTDAARVIKNMMHERFFNESAARGILIRIKGPIDDASITKVIQAKMSFTDDQWSYMALEFFRDQMIGALFPVLKPSEGFWKNCTDCQDDFYFYLPKRCKKCWEANRSIIQDAKGGPY
jgi:hypothetical protein